GFGHSGRKELRPRGQKFWLRCVLDRLTVFVVVRNPLEPTRPKVRNPKPFILRCSLPSSSSVAGSPQARSHRATTPPTLRSCHPDAVHPSCLQLRRVKMNSAGLHQMIGRSMVELSILPPRAQPKSFKRVRHFYGIIIVLKPNFAYVVADPKFFVGKLHGRLKLYFDGNRSITYDKPEIHLSENVAGICCPHPAGYNTTMIQEIRLAERELAQSQEVHVYSPAFELLTPGNVMGERNNQRFQCNCAAMVDTEDGSPVIDNNGDLVGMCDSFQNLYLTARSTYTIAYEIMNYQGIQFESIQHTLQHLRSFNP
ncbi:unnamed protein product, partial [Urochloa humidicola]